MKAPACEPWTLGGSVHKQMVQRTVIRVGLPLGLSIVAAVQPTSSSDVVDVVLTLIAATALVSVPVILVSAASRRWRGRSPIWTLSALLLIVGTTVAASIGTIRAAAAVPHGKWDQLPSAPIGAAAFAGPGCHSDMSRDAFTAYVVTREGQHFRMSVNREPLEWTAVDGVLEPIDVSGACNVVRVGGPPYPPYRGRALATHQITDIGADCGGTRYYRLMTDMTVWQWSTGACSLSIGFGIAFFLLLSLGLGTYAFVLQGREGHGFPEAT